MVCAVVAIGALGAAQFLSTGRRQGEDQTLSAGLAATEKLSERVRTVEAVLHQDLEVAVGLPPFLEAVLLNVDDATLKDLFATEDWWLPFRNRSVMILKPGTQPFTWGPLSGVLSAFTAGRIKSFGDGLSLMPGDPAVWLYAREVRDPTGRREIATTPTLVFAQSVDRAALDDVPVLILQDGDAALRVAGSFKGPVPERPWEMVRGTPPDGQWLSYRERRFVAMHIPVSGHERLWALFPAPAAGLLSSSVGTSGLWLTGGMSAFLGLVMFLYPRKRSRILHEGAQSREPASAPLTAAPRVVSGAPAAVGATMVAPGKTQNFGRYTLLHPIGQGGMAEVWAAFVSGAEGFQKFYAIKRLRPELALNRAAVDQFIDEAKLGSILAHSNIVPVLDFGSVGSGYYLAQELVPGRNLSQLVERQCSDARVSAPAVDVDLVLFIMREVLEALSYAHEKCDDEGNPMRIVHRDVSAGNVMVTEQGEVKLLDFGIAKATQRVASTDIGNVKGNAAFMSTEQARGQNVDARSDIFAAGLVMFYLLTGRSFYEGDTSAMIYYSAGVGPTPAHLAAIEQLPAPVPAILSRALEVQPENRFQTAREFAGALGRPTGNERVRLSALVTRCFGEELKQQAQALTAASASAKGHRAKVG